MHCSRGSVFRVFKRKKLWKTCAGYFFPWLFQKPDTVHERVGRVQESRLSTVQHSGLWLHPRLLDVMFYRVLVMIQRIWLVNNGNTLFSLVIGNDTAHLIHIICADGSKLEGRSSSYLKEIKQLTWAHFAGGNRVLYFVGNIFKEFVLWLVLTVVCDNNPPDVDVTSLLTLWTVMTLAWN